MPTRAERVKAAKEFFLENYRNVDEYGALLGYEAITVDRDKKMAETRLKIRKHHLSMANKVHGGVVSGFFDYSCGAAVFSTLGPRDFGSTVELKVNYFKPLFLGDELRAITRVVFRGKRLCVIHGLMYRNDEPDPVAMATATFNVVSGESHFIRG